MAQSRHRRARDLWLLRVLTGTTTATLALAAGLLGALAEDSKLLRTAVVLALTGLVLLGFMVAAGAARGSQPADTSAELAEAARELAALRAGLAQVAAAPPGNGAIGRPADERKAVDVGARRFGRPR